MALASSTIRARVCITTCDGPTLRSWGELMHIEIKAWSLLLLTLTFFAVLCAAAALSAVMQPARWSERQGSGQTGF